MPVGVIYTTIVIVILLHAHYPFVHLSYHTLTLFKLVYFAVDHDELVLDVATVYLRVHLLVAQILVRQAALDSVLLPIPLEIDEAVLHYV